MSWSKWLLHLHSSCSIYFCWKGNGKEKGMMKKNEWSEWSRSDFRKVLGSCLMTYHLHFIYGKHGYTWEMSFGRSCTKLEIGSSFTLEEGMCYFRWATSSLCFRDNIDAHWANKKKKKKKTLCKKRYVIRIYHMARLCCLCDVMTEYWYKQRMWFNNIKKLEEE